jgi:hypothetical protein
MRSMLESALGYAARGIAIFPCKPGGKAPLTRRGFHEASTERAQIEAWWGANPRANIAGVTGAMSGYAVLDFDAKSGGLVTRDDLMVEVGSWETAVAATGGGGEHHYFRLPPSRSLPRRIGVRPGMDLLGDGGYVLMPPSVTDAPYAWRGGTITEAPSWVFELVGEKRAGTHEGEGVANADAYARVALERVSAAVASAIEGTRNEALNKAAHAMGRLAPYLDRNQAQCSLLEAAIAAGLTDAEARRTIASGWTAGAADPRTLLERSKGVKSSSRIAVTRTFDQIEARPVSWLWKHRVPFGMITLVDGRPGAAKSTMALDIAARLTRGEPMPSEDSPLRRRSILIVAAEDSATHTIKPRLELAGADLSRVHILDFVRVGELERLVSLPNDVDLIEGKIAELDVGLVIFDSLMSCLGGRDSYKDADVRSALLPLATIADRSGAAIVCLRHFTKAPGGSALMKGVGSIAFSAVARSVLVVGHDASDASRRVVASAKSNLSPEPPSLEFCLVSVGEHVRIEWNGPVNVRADDLVSQEPTGGEGTAIVKAEEFLRERLGDGSVDSLTLDEDAREAGIANRTLDRAKSRLGVVAQKSTFSGRWRCSIPGKIAKDATSLDVAPLGDDLGPGSV